MSEETIELSRKRHSDDTEWPEEEGRVRDQSDERAMEAARELRARREAAQGPAPIDNGIHRELPLTKVAYALLALTVAAYALSRLGGNINSPELESVASIATTLLFLSAFVTWFVSRHQAKKLTKERDGA